MQNGGRVAHCHFGLPPQHAEGVAMSSNQLIDETLEQLAEKCGDLTDDVYARFEANCPQGSALLADASPIVRGRMLGEILDAIRMRSAQEKQVDIYIATETVTHMPIGIDYSIYESLFQALYETVDSALADEWTPEARQLWRQHTQGMLAAVRHGLADGAAAAGRSVV
jgi:hemoglobin-like flavoprotein